MAARPNPRRRGDDGGPKKSHISPEAREKLSQLAKQRHAEGRFGGAEFGKLGGRGRTREKRLAQEALGEFLQEPEIQDLMKAALQDALKNDSIGVRLKAVQMAGDIERDNSKREIAMQAVEGEQRSRDELLRVLSKKLSSGPASGILRRAIAERAEEPITDAEVVEEDDASN